MADGTKKSIMDISVGDQVLAADPNIGTVESAPIIDLIRHSGPHTMVDVYLSDGTIVNATEGHPFYNATSGSWTNAIDLKVGDKVQTASDDLLVIVRLDISQQTLTAYNLTVDKLHTYYAGVARVLVHNAQACNVDYSSRRSAFTAAKDRAGVPRSQQGSVSVVVNSATGAATRERYLPYGGSRNVEDSLAAPTDRGWLGQTRDRDSGLSYLNARYYDAELAHFISPDPLSDQRSPQTANGYVYAADNPITYKDPSGLKMVYTTHVVGSTGKPESWATVARDYHTNYPELRKLNGSLTALQVGERITVLARYVPDPLDSVILGGGRKVDPPKTARYLNHLEAEIKRLRIESARKREAEKLKTFEWKYAPFQCGLDKACKARHYAEAAIVGAGARSLARQRDPGVKCEYIYGMMTCIGGHLSNRGGTTIGDTFFTDYFSREEITPNIIKHEKVHRDQWRKYGAIFGGLYFMEPINACSNGWEIQAGIDPGGYRGDCS